MMTTIQGRWCVLALSLIWIIWFFGPVVWHPDDYLFGGEGDGIKNYFTFAYHVRYDADWLAFEGCNYPYGDHVAFTDGHPILSLLFGWIPLVKNHPIGFLNVFMILGFLIALQLLYQLLIMWRCSPNLALAGAWILHMGQPQLERLTGHLSLSEVWLIPLMLVCLEHWRLQAKWRYILIAFMAQAYAWWLHPYLGLMLGGMMLGYPLLLALLTRRLPQKFWSLLALGAGTVVAYFIWIKCTDHHTDRPSSGIGFLTYLTTLKSIAGGIDGNIIGWIFGEYSPWTGSGEGKAYLGLVPIVTIIFGFIYFPKRLFGALRMQTSVAVWLIIALIFLMFAAGIPFIWGLQTWLSKIPYLEHFRCPGRFVWVFYYIVAAFSVYIIQLLSASIRLPWNLCYLALALVATADHVIHHRQVQSALMATPNFFNPRFIPEEDQKAIADIRSETNETTAIWTVPQICYGSDFYTRYFDERKVRHAYIVAYHAGKPLLGTINPRASYRESRYAMMLTAANVFDKPIWHDMQALDRFYMLELDKPKWDGEERLTSKLGQWLTVAEERQEWKDFSATYDEPYLMNGAKDIDERGYLRITQPKYQAVLNWQTDTLQVPIWVHASAWFEFRSYRDLPIRWMVEEHYQGEKKLLVEMYSNTSSFQFDHKSWVYGTFKALPNRTYLIFFEYDEWHPEKILLTDVALQKVDSTNLYGSQYRPVWRRFKSMDHTMY